MLFLAPSHSAGEVQLDASTSLVTGLPYKKDGINHIFSFEASHEQASDLRLGQDLLKLGYLAQSEF